MIWFPLTAIETKIFTAVLVTALNSSSEDELVKQFQISSIFFSIKKMVLGPVLLRSTQVGTDLYSKAGHRHEYILLYPYVIKSCRDDGMQTNPF